MESRGEKRQPLGGGCGEARAAAVQELRFSGWGGFQGGVLQAGPRVLSEGLRGVLPGAGAAWPRAFPEADAKPDNPDKPGAPGTALSLAPTCSRRPSMFLVAVSASRRLPAGCQASMIGLASDAFLPPRTRRLCLSPGSLRPLHESSAHTRFPALRSQSPVGGRARGKGSGPDCSTRKGWAEA